SSLVISFFFSFSFYYTATSVIYTLSLHDALPIYFLQGNALSSLEARKLFHADAKWLYGDGTIGHGMANLIRWDEMKNAVLLLNFELSEMAAQFRERISIYGDRRKMPQVGSERGNVVHERFRVALFGWRKQKRPVLLVRKNRGGQMDFHRCAFLALLRQKVHDASFAGFTELRH